MNTILTKVNTRVISFNEQITLSKQPINTDLSKFVVYMHKNADLISNEDSISVYTSKGSYKYINYGKYICRVDLVKNVKKWYLIS